MRTPQTTAGSGTNGYFATWVAFFASLYYAVHSIPIVAKAFNKVCMCVFVLVCVCVCPFVCVCVLVCVHQRLLRHLGCVLRVPLLRCALHPHCGQGLRQGVCACVWVCAWEGERGPMGYFTFLLCRSLYPYDKHLRISALRRACSLGIFSLTYSLS